METAFDLITSGHVPDDACLNSVFEIENLLLRIQELNTKVDHLKGLKKFRAETVDEEIKSVNYELNQYRKVILNTMQTLKPDQKTMQFPSIGKVSRRTAKDSYKIDDEAQLVQYLDNKGDKDKVVISKEVLDIRAAKKLIEDYIERGENVPGVTEITGSEGVTITFEAKSTKAVRKPKTTEKVSKPKPTMDELAELNV